MISRCRVEVLVGHYETIPQPLEIDVCSAASIVSCRAADLSNPRPIPGIEKRPADDISYAEGSRLALSDFEAGKRHAKHICASRDCGCKEVVVYINWSWLDWFERNLVMNGCGKREVVKCCAQ